MQDGSQLGVYLWLALALLVLGSVYFFVLLRACVRLAFLARAIGLPQHQIV